MRLARNITDQRVKDQIRVWVEIGKRNPWIFQAYDPPFTDLSFTQFEDVDELIQDMFKFDWCLGEAFFIGDLCFINQVEGGSEYLVIKGSIPFESISIRAMGPEGLKDFIWRVQRASDEQLASLTY